jgi:peptide/nickel transport system permease protein
MDSPKTGKGRECVRYLDYLVRKIAFALVTLFAVLTINFYLFRIVPGDPVSMITSPRMRPETRDEIRAAFGLDKPLWFNREAMQETGEFSELFDSQYFRYLKNLTQGNLGVSFRQKRDVSELIASRLRPTLLLMFTGELAGIFIGSVLGIVAAWKARSWIDAGSLGLGLILFALPAFWLGIVLLILSRGVLPAGGYITLGAQYANTIERWLDIGKHLVLPATTMALLLFGAYMLVVRNSTLEVLAEDYILTAKAKGLKQTTILRSHALKNAALPLVTIIALDLGVALGGMIQIETIFSWPGLGRLMFDAISQRDYPVLQGVFLLLAVGVIAANFLADLTYIYLDPRVKA